MTPPLAALDTATFDLGHLWWTMLHYFWIGLALVPLAAAGRLLLRSAALLRYVHSLCWLLVLALLPLGVGVWMADHLPDAWPTIDVALQPISSNTASIIELHVEPDSTADSSGGTAGLPSSVSSINDSRARK